MMEVKLSNGPKIVIGDGCDEIHALRAISSWLQDNRNMAVVQKVDVEPDRVLVAFWDNLSPVLAAEFARKWLNDGMDGHFADREMAYSIGLSGKPINCQSVDGV